MERENFSWLVLQMREGGFFFRGGWTLVGPARPPLLISRSCAQPDGITYKPGFDTISWRFLFCESVVPWFFRSQRKKTVR